MLKNIQYLLIVILFSAMTPWAWSQDDDEPSAGLNEATLKGLQWRGIGPALTAGRIADIAVHPTDRSTWYVGVGSGGVWKTINRGITWEPVFDTQSSYSIGSIAIDGKDPDTIWVGSGENVSGRHVAYGDGVYRSVDAGKTWTNMGLADSQHIGVILIDPRDSNVVYVAAQGPLWSAGGDRGLFKTTDGGENWTNILSAGEYTGVNEVHMDPRNPDVLYASTHQRLRTVAALMDGGPESGIHKSEDGGQTWRQLKSGLPKEDMGKIGLAVSPVNPDVVYATIELAQRTGGFYRSENGGETWEKLSKELYSGTGPHYYQEIFASPHDVDVVYQVNPTLYRTEDGGKNFKPVRARAVHGDYHEVVFDPDDPGYLMVGTDGGVYESYDRAANFRFFANMPITQFYKVAVDYAEPFYNVYGGTQDNNTQGGPSRTDNVHGIRNSDWFVTVFADGHQPAVDPTDPDIVYSEWQQGNLVRTDRTTGEIIYIQPQPAADEETERFNWDAPILISTHDPKRLYFGSQRVWRSDDRGDSWTPISSDLSHNRDRLKMPMMGRVWSWDSAWDLMAMSKYGTITSLAESPLDQNLLYAGTDDGRIHVSEDGGENWREADNLPGMPDEYFVNDIRADLHDVNTVYLIVDYHKLGDFAPYVLKSSNRGRSWNNITGNLPERHLVWRIVQDHVNPSLLFVATEFGVFFSLAGGNTWTKLSGGTPNISFRDLVIQRRENDLVGATFGRSFYIFDDYSPLRELSDEKLKTETMLFPVRDALWYIPRMPLGEFRENSKSSQGDAYFIAPNPPFGAVISYYLPESILSAKDTRRKAEKPIEKEGGDTPYPGFDAMRAEEIEEEPGVVLTISDSQGQLVRHLEAPAKAGFHRVAWDLRVADSAPWKPEAGEPEYMVTKGPLVVPGNYTVSLQKRINGQLQDTGLSTPVTVKVMRQNKLATATPAEVTAFGLRLDDMMRRSGAAKSAIEETLIQLGAIKDTVMRSNAGLELREAARDLELKVLQLQQRLSGNEARDLLNDQGPMSVNERASKARMGTAWSTYGPTPTHLRSLEIAEQGLADIKRELDAILQSDMPALHASLDAAGVPWTPGRGIPESR